MSQNDVYKIYSHYIALEKIKLSLYLLQNNGKVIEGSNSTQKALYLYTYCVKIFTLQE